MTKLDKKHNNDWKWNDTDTRHFVSHCSKNVPHPQVIVDVIVKKRERVKWDSSLQLIFLILRSFFIVCFYYYNQKHCFLSILSLRVCLSLASQHILCRLFVVFVFPAVLEGITSLRLLSPGPFTHTRRRTYTHIFCEVWKSVFSFVVTLFYY